VRTLVSALVVLLVATSAGAAELDRDCRPVCASTCLKPVAIADRWDDVTGVPGHPAWTGNGRYDAEDFTDAHADGIWSPGESFVDGNANGMYDAEHYHPTLTGYTPDPVPGNHLAPEGDLGRVLRLRPADAAEAKTGAWVALAFPAYEGGAPLKGGSAFEDALARCAGPLISPSDRLEPQSGRMEGPAARGFAAMVAGDPDARWDPVAQEVVGMRDPERSSRIVLVALYDPRGSSRVHRKEIRVAKIAAFFIEEPGVDGSFAGRFLKVRSASFPCGCECTAENSFLRACP